MDKQETDCIKDGSETSYGSTSDSTSSDPPFPAVRRQSYTLKMPSCTVYAEWLLGAVFFSMIGSYPLIEQYIYARSAKEYPILANHTENSSISQACSRINSTDSELYNATQKVQAKTSEIMMMLNVISAVPTVFSTLVINSYADKFYRKPALYIPVLGLTIMQIIVISVVYFELHLYLLYIAYLVFGFTGGSATIMAGSFAYITDIVHPDNRAFRLVMLDVIVVLSGAASESLLGFLIKEFSFVIPCLVIVSVAFLALLYAVFIIPETHIPVPGATFSLKESLMATYNVYSKPDPRRFRLIILVFIILLAQLPVTGSQAVSTLFQLNAPLCWGPGLIGMYLASALIIIQFGSLIGALVFVKCLKMAEIHVCIIGNISGIAAYIYYSMCRRTWEVFLGSLFSGMAILYTMASIGSSIGFNTIYIYTLSVFRGMVFLVCACCFFISIILACVYLVYDKRSTPVQLKSLNSLDASDRTQ